jgi:galactokinase
MTASGLLKKLKSGDADKQLAELYGEPAVASQKKRLTAMLGRLAARFPDDETSLFRAPGRTELGGNHTDHNRGRVLAGAVDLDIAAAVVPTGDNRVTLASSAFRRHIVVDLADTSPKKAEEHTTAGLVRGIARFLAERGRPVGGFWAEIDATLPQGAGLSSSAAIEVLIGFIFNELYGNGRLTLLDLARIGQRAENEYYGKPCGLMDQVASAQGGVVAVDFKDAAKPRIESVRLDPERAGFALFVVATGGDHANLTAAYAAIPAEMKATAAFFGKEVLRDVTQADFLRRLPDLRAKTGDRAVLRALHFFGENDRVAQQAGRLKRRDFEGFLELVRASGDSSWELLQNCQLPETPRSQGVALGLALSRQFLSERTANRGAARVHGGGFSGTIQCYVPLAEARAYRSFMETVFGKGSVMPLRLCPRGAMRVL